MQSGHLEIIQKIQEDCFLPPVVITLKKDKSVKIVLDLRKKDSCMKMRPHLPNTEIIVQTECLPKLQDCRVKRYE